MPEAYEKLRDAFRKKGASLKAAKRKAAKIYQSKHPGFSFSKYEKHKK